MKPTVKRIASSKAFVAGIAVLLVYTLLGFFLAPYMLERYAPGYAQERLGAQATIGNIRINPFVLSMEVQDFRLAEHNGQPIAAFKRLFVNFQLASLFRWAWTFRDVQIEELDLHVVVQRDGNLNLAALARRTSETPPSGQRPPRILVQHLALSDSKLTFTDLSDRTPASATLAPISLNVLDLATLPDRNGQYTVTAAVRDGGSMTWRGDVSLAPLSSTGELELKGFKLATAWAFARDQVRFAEPKGSLDIAARYQFAYGEGKATLGFDNIRARVSALALSGSDGKAILALEAIAASDARFDLTSRKLVVPNVELSNGRVVLERGKDGHISLAELFRPKKERGKEAIKPAQKPPPTARPWMYVLETLKLQGIELAMVDHSYRQPITYDTRVMAATLRSITNDGKTPIRFDAALGVARGGKVNSSGTIAQNFSSAEAQLNITELALLPLQPLLAQYATLDLKSGQASASAQVHYQAGGDGPALRAIGTMSINDVLVNETPSGERFLSWKTMAADDVTLTLAPNQLAIKEIRVTEPGAKFVISKDRKLNLAQVLKTEPRQPEPVAVSDGKALVKPPAVEPRPKEPKSNAFAANIGRVTVRNATVDFADFSLVVPFATRVTRFSGAAVGIATDRSSRTEVKFRGRVEPSGRAVVEGGLSTFDPKAFTDIQVDFDNVEMPLLTPYTATFAGRKIASGRLWLNLHYKIINSELAGHNKVVMDNFTLGERIESPSALDLPLDLAVALLTDSHGRITVAVPITGNLDNPKFDYKHLIWESIASLVTRVITAPFRAIAGLFGGGGGGEEIGGIDFDPGRAGLRPPEREKLDKVAEVLRTRPRLKVVIRGPYDTKRDGEAMRNERVRREIAEALGVHLEQRQDPGPVAYNDAPTQRALEKLLVARAGTKGLPELEQKFKKTAERNPERLNPVTSLFGKASPDREFYEAVFNRLVELYPLPETEPKQLATRRAEAIIEYLIRSAAIIPSRVEAGEIRAVTAPSDQAISTELALDLGPATE